MIVLSFFFFVCVCVCVLGVGGGVKVRGAHYSRYCHQLPGQI